MATILNPSLSIRSRIFPVRFRSTASGLIIANVFSTVGDFFFGKKLVNKKKAFELAGAQIPFQKSIKTRLTQNDACLLYHKFFLKILNPFHLDGIILCYIVAYINTNLTRLASINRDVGRFVLYAVINAI